LIFRRKDHDVFLPALGSVTGEKNRVETRGAEEEKAGSARYEGEWMKRSEKNFPEPRSFFKTATRNMNFELSTIDNFLE
jgi:hypothetical protein